MSTADGRQERGDFTGMSFEMVRSSVYSAVQMKVSREEMHKAEGETGVAGGGVYVACFGNLQLTTSPAVLPLLPGTIYSLCASFFLSLFLSLSFDKIRDRFM